MTEEEKIGEIVDEMYDMISGPAGPRDWSRQAKCIHPDAKQLRTGVDENGKAWIKTMSLDEYRENTTPFFAANNFFEVEIGRRIDVFGNMAHVWSAYEARSALGDAKPERRGINSIQLYRDETGRWRIISLIWDYEREGLSISESFQTAKGRSGIQ
jgi:hypothetical protein